MELRLDGQATAWAVTFAPIAQCIQAQIACDSVHLDHAVDECLRRDLTSVPVDDGVQLIEVLRTHGRYSQAVVLARRWSELNGLSHEDVVRLVTELGRNYLQVGNLELGSLCFSVLCRSTVSLKETALVSMIHRRMGHAHLLRGNLSDARDSYNHAYEIDMRLQNWQGLVEHLGSNGHINRVTDRLERAVQLYEQGLSLAREHNFSFDIASLCDNLGSALSESGSNSAELYFSLLTESISIFSQLGCIQGVAKARFNLGAVFYRQSRYEEAYAEYKQAHSDFSSLGFRWEVKELRYRMAIVADKLGERQEFRDHSDGYFSREDRFAWPTTEPGSAELEKWLLKRLPTSIEQAMAA